MRAVGQRAQCQRLEAMRVASHRGRVLPVDTSHPPKYLTKKQMSRLVQRNIQAVDLDLFSSSNSTHWVGHPDDLRNMWGVPDAFILTDEQILQRSNYSMTSLTDLLTHAAAFNISLMLELKGKARANYHTLFVDLMRHVAKHSMQSSVSLWVSSWGEMQELERLYISSGADELGAFSHFRFGKPIFDVGAAISPTGLPFCEGQIQPYDIRSYSFISPSLRCVTHHFMQQPRVVQWTETKGHEIVVWAADDPSKISFLAKAGVSCIISNRPVLMARHLRTLVQKCKQKYRHQHRLPYTLTLQKSINS